MTNEQLAGLILSIALPVSNVLGELRNEQDNLRKNDESNDRWSDDINSLCDVGEVLCSYYYAVTGRSLDDAIDELCEHRFGV